MVIEWFELLTGMEATEAGVWKLFLAVAIHRCPHLLLIYGILPPIPILITNSFTMSNFTALPLSSVSALK